MNLTEALKALEAAGSPSHRKTYARHGITGPMFGVPYSFLTPFVKKIGRDHDLALKLWASGNYDARTVATMIADPDRADVALIERWLRDASNYPLNDAVAALAARIDGFTAAHIARWCSAKDEWTSAFGWHVAARRCQAGATPAQDLVRAVEIIERNAHQAPNRTRHAMNNALIAIGCRGGALQTKAVAAAKRIGKVEVDHGDTSCQTPDAAAYIARTLAHRAAREAKAKASASARASTSLRSKSGTKSARSAPRRRRKPAVAAARA